MEFLIVNRKYMVGGKFIRFGKMNNGVKTVGYKIAVWHYELRMYLN